MKPLAGIKVLDLTRTLAGPICTQALGELGAEVIKVESPGLGDETRGWPPFAGKGLGAAFLSVNRNKRSVVIDMKTPEGRSWCTSSPNTQISQSKASVLVWQSDWASTRRRCKPSTPG